MPMASMSMTPCSSFFVVNFEKVIAGYVYVWEV